MLHFPLHGDTPSESSTGVRTRITLLPELRGRGDESADLRRLLFGDLPALRHAAGVVRRTGYRIVEPVFVLEAQPTEGCGCGADHV